ncbi:MAG: 4-alpha-glucanotransferase [Beijerinckiaceae bacterium]|nr:4-alpha-glucanotransferase [Beijerinckiaceae bacterium]
MNKSLKELAQSHGIQTQYVSQQGDPVDISDDATRELLKVLKIDPAEGFPGVFEEAEPTSSCELPSEMQGRRVWGITCQLYSLRSSRNLGIGDFGDLASLAEVAAEAGAAFLGVNPLHSLFFSDPGRFSPYSPSTRRFLNPFYIAIDRLDGGDEAIESIRKGEPAAFARLGGDLLDYAAVGRVKAAALRRVFEAQSGRSHTEDGFEGFRQENGDALRSFALFEAISAHEVRAGGHAGWHGWPGDLQNRRGDAVSRFEAEHEDDIRFHEWLQFVADGQLGEAHVRAKRAGMRIGLYLDFAVGVAPDGAETWADPELAVRDARVGSPPDMYNSEGQDWGIAPLSPEALASRKYQPLTDAYRAIMHHAGAMRIDHAMGLARLWWVPASGKPAGGGYVRYPLGAMIDAVAKASREFGAIVIGEDLGTVPAGFRPAMEAANILSYRVLNFERVESGAFTPPAQYPVHALACISTHDLATLAGWWVGSDIKLRAETGRQTDEASSREALSRERDKRAVLEALNHESLLDPRYASALLPGSELPASLDEDLAIAIHRFGARATAVLFAVQLEDALMSARQANLPGTTNEYPNWRIRSEVPIEDLGGGPRFKRMARAMREERPDIS